MMYKTLLCLIIIYPPLGIGISVLILSYVLVAKNHHVYNINPIKISILAGMFWGVIGYCMIPSDESDLTRYFDLVYLQYNHDDLLFTFNNDVEFLYLRDAFFHLAGVSCDEYLIPFLVGLLTYGMTFYMFFDSYKRMKIKLDVRKICILLMPVITVIPFYSIIGNVRCVSSFIVVTFAVYREYIQQKRNMITYLLYILPLGMHLAPITLILIRLISALIKGRSSKYILSIFALSVPVFIQYSIDVIDGLYVLGDVGLYLQAIIIKANIYLSGIDNDNMGVKKDFIYYYERVYGTFFVVMFIIIINKIKNYNNYANFLNYMHIIAIVTLATLSIEAGAFWRYESVVVLLSPIIFLMIKEKTMCLPLLKYSLIFPLLPTLMTIYAGINLSAMLVKFFETSYLMIFVNFVFGLLRLIGFI